MVLLFGSQARGDVTVHSDIDIIIIKDTQKRYKDRVKVLLTATKPRIPVDLIVYTPQEFRHMVRVGNRFVEKALRDGVVLYDKVGYYTEVKEAVTSGRIDMRPDPAREGRNCLRNAERALSRAQHHYNGEFYEGACFECQQAAEFALKAFLYSKGESYIRTHSVENLGQLCESYEPDFATIARDAKKLDTFYVTTRYPDTLGGDLPEEHFDKEDAHQALDRAT